VEKGEPAEGLLLGNILGGECEAKSAWQVWPLASSSPWKPNSIFRKPIADTRVAELGWVGSFKARLTPVWTVCAGNQDFYGFVDETYRRALVRRFPYATVFEHAETMVTVYAVFHTSRDPEKWRHRLP
jgi:hypothetical protein